MLREGFGEGICPGFRDKVAMRDVFHMSQCGKGTFMPIQVGTFVKILKFVQFDEGAR